ncbi:heavy metal translocating P-type ATPase [Rubrivivax gelatinosus]|uniref:heavy metal translocating P-type ATPase n=1 Tax=Rubrivivax gelatinosus TaxID=28068 RepID=UPI001904090E|nr:heavy metal translocating P-type ATPase [Rubrivivax gelatinosus]
MTPAPWLLALEPVHACAGRVRWRYRCAPGSSRDPRSLQRGAEALRGVRSVRINAAARSLAIAYDAALTDAATLAAELRALPPPTAAAGAAAEGAPSLVGVAAAGATLLAGSTLPLALRSPVSAANALPLFGAALEDFLRTGITSHVLEATAVAISIGRGDHLAANTTAFLLALGEYLEHSIERRSDALLRQLLRPADDQVWVEREGQEQRIAADAVEVGDTVIVATGSVVPVDGTVLGGEALVNEATMTGESVPVARRRGDRVLSGTLLEEGRLRVYAERVGRQAAAARIADFVAQSLQAKGQTQLEAARLADRLVPMVLGLAGGTWALSGDWRRVAAVLQADYSCALKLATPVAFKSSMAAAGRAGMLVKGARALERLAAADTFVFDKTGTLTEGSLLVTDSVALDPAFTAEDLLNLAASVEEHYFHPMALAVVAAAQRLAAPRHFEHAEVEFIVAHGVASVVQGKRVVVGSRHFVEDDEGITLGPHEDRIAGLQAAGKTLLYIGWGGRLVGVLALRDRLRADSAATVARLRTLGVRRIVMLTGDTPERARAMADELGLDAFHAGLLPEDKAAVLHELAADGSRIAFVGDGVNDAPALSGAHVGIAMHRGADVARLAADVVLLEDSIARVADAKALALATRQLIDSNFRLTMVLNTSILGAAALGVLSPVSASLLHNGSTIAILLRALAGGGLPRPARRRKAG